MKVNRLVFWTAAVAIFFLIQIAASYLPGPEINKNAWAYKNGSAGDGYAFGWRVTYNGRVLCDDPWVWQGLKEIECE